MFPNSTDNGHSKDNRLIHLFSDRTLLQTGLAGHIACSKRLFLGCEAYAVLLGYPFRMTAACEMERLRAQASHVRRAVHAWRRNVACRLDGDDLIRLVEPARAVAITWPLDDIIR